MLDLESLVASINHLLLHPNHQATQQENQCHGMLEHHISFLSFFFPTIHHHKPIYLLNDSFFLNNKPNYPIIEMHKKRGKVFGEEKDLHIH